MSDNQPEETQETAQSKIKLMPKNINISAQNRHIVGTDGYNQYVINQKSKGEYGPSILYGDIKTAQDLINKYSGTGTADVVKGKWMDTEKIKTDSVIGIVVNNLNGVQQITANFKIHYGKDGTHIVPDYDKNRKGMRP